MDTLRIKSRRIHAALAQDAACRDDEAGSVIVVAHTHDIEIVGERVRKTFVSWADGEPDREWAALTYLDEHARGLCPRPITRELVAGRPAVVMSRVHGDPLTGKLSSRQHAALATALRRLFAVTVPVDLAVRANGPVEFPRRFGPWVAEEYDWCLCQDAALVRQAVDVSASWLRGFHVGTDWIKDPVVALGDGNLDNVLWDGDTCRLIDWEEYGVSDLCYEIADVVEHASSRLERRLDVEALLASVNLNVAQQMRMEEYRRMFACFWLAMLLPGNGGWRRNPPGSTEDQARHVLDLMNR